MQGSSHSIAVIEPKSVTAPANGSSAWREVPLTLLLFSIINAVATRLHWDGIHSVLVNGGPQVCPRGCRDLADVIKLKV